jgi:hypothetical protein
MFFLLLDGTIEGTFHLLECPVNGVVQRGGVIRHRSWRQTIQVRFHHTTFVLLAALGTFLVTQMNINSRDSLTETT